MTNSCARSTSPSTNVESRRTMQAAADGRSLTCGFDPRVTGIRDIDLELVEVHQLPFRVVAEPDA